MPRARSHGDPGSTPPGFDPSLHDALTDLHTYALLLEADWVRVGRRIDSLACAHADAALIADLTELRAKMGEELEALRAAAGSLRDDAEAGR
jgi:hypothetical protein